MSPQTRFGLLLACFFGSGLAALVYQTAWTRQFATVFGTSELAVATVLAAYMGGLGLGAAVAARAARTVRRPVATYGVLEGGIALAALVGVPAGLALARPLTAWVFGARGDLPAEGGLATALFYAAVSFAILLVPTGLMGATLPLLARHAVLRERDIGARVGALYAVNTVGAIAGALLAGFWWLEALGLRGTLWVAAAANGAVFAAALALARGAAPALPVPPGPAGAPSGGRWILPAMAVSGAVSFGDEVLWTRLLGHLLGGSVTAFATMLASFLTGIALGSLAAARRATTPARAARGFAVVQIGAAAFSVAAFAALDRAPALAAWLVPRAGSLAMADVGVAVLTLLPSTLCIGATFPFAVRILARAPHEAAGASGRVYGWNTAGAIAGALGVGFLALPALGFEGTLRGAALANLALAAWAALAGPARSRALAGAAAVAAVLLVALPLAPPWTLLRTSPLERRPAEGRIAHYAVGRSATVLLLEQFGAWQLRTNGLPESTISPVGGRAARFPVARWLGLLPSLAHPEARSLLVVGLGGGLVVERVPPSVAAIDVVELEPEVVRANRVLGPRRAADPLADPRLRLVENDARGALALTRRRYDAIVSQPSHPWTAGASHLYTREFFGLVRERLAPDGVFVQWIGLSFVDGPLLRGLVATLVDAFPHVEVFRPAVGGLLFLASGRPLDPPASAATALAAAGDVYAEVGVFGPVDVVATRVLDAPGARAFAAGAPVDTDDRNALLMRGPRVMRAASGPFEPDPLLAAHEPAWPADVARVAGVRRLVARGLHARAERVAAGARDPAERALGLGLAALGRGERGPGLARLRRAAALRPGWPDAVHALAEARSAGVLPLDDAARAALAALRPVDAAVARADAAAAGGAWRRVADLDAALALADPLDPAFPAAARLRIRWRLVLATDAPGALGLADRLLAATDAAPDLVLRARAALAAGHAAAALQTLAEATSRLRPGPGSTWAARGALELLGALPVDAAATGERARLAARLRSLSGP